MLELYIPRKHYKHGKTAQNFNQINLTKSRLHEKYVPGMLSQQNIINVMSDHFHTTNIKPKKKNINYDENLGQLMDNKIILNTNESDRSKQAQTYDNDIEGN